MTAHLLSLASLAMAIGAIVCLAWGVSGGSDLLLLIAVVCAVNCALAQGLALSRTAGGRIDALLDGMRHTPRPTNDNRGDA